MIIGLECPTARADNEAVVQAWLAAWNSHDVSTFVGTFTDDAVLEHVPLNSVSRGTTEIRAFAQFVFTALPDLKMTVLNSSVKGGHAEIEWLFSATDVGVYVTGDRKSTRLNSSHMSTSYAVFL